jgi:factor associated with neutral sphingomyelinase activation
MAASHSNKPVFFWERASSSSSSSSSRHRRTKGRFSLLLLEHGEYFVDDIAVFHFPMPGAGANGQDLSFQQCDALKLQGRLKLCTKSFVFEPVDVRKPLVRFPFRSMGADFPRAYEISAADQRMCSIDASGFFLFTCSTVFEMKAGDKIGPYAQIDSVNSREPFEFLFAVSHTDMGFLLARMAKLRQLYRCSDAGDEAGASRLLAEVAALTPTAPFDSSKLIDFHEKLLLENAIAVKRIRPLVLSFGHLMVTDSRVYFQPAQLNNVGESTQHFDLRGIAKVYKRRYLLRDVALELILSDGESVLFGFDAAQYRDYVYGILSAEPHIAAERVSLKEMTDRWVRKEISNFDYLMFINSEAGRSLSDLAQYPVFPHVIADFTSRSLDLDRPETFRDLSKPIGALNPQRLQFFKERCLSMPPADPAMGIPPPFLYGTHYSTPGYVLYYIVRVAPEHMLCLQNGKFDATDRMFISLASMWDSCLKNPADLKELIPEFFSCKSGEFLLNSADLDLGRRHNGERLDDVELPPWAKSPRDFIKKHVKALESDYVSNNLHKWIDLIFGVRQRGQLAVESDNVFYHLTYEGAVDMDAIKNDR